MRGSVGSDPRCRFGERRTEHDHLGVRVVPDVDELGVGVAVVGVDVHQRRLRTGEEELAVLRPVVEVEGDLRLMGAAVVEQISGDCVGSLLELRPADTDRAVDQGVCVRQDLGHRLPDVGEGPTVGGAGPGTGVDVGHGADRRSVPIVGQPQPASRSDTICHTSGSMPMPTWVLRTSSMVTSGLKSSMQARHATMPSRLL